MYVVEVVGLPVNIFYNISKFLSNFSFHIMSTFRGWDMQKYQKASCIVVCAWLLMSQELLKPSASSSNPLQFKLLPKLVKTTTDASTCTPNLVSDNATAVSLQQFWIKWYVIVLILIVHNVTLINNNLQFYSTVRTYSVNFNTVMLRVEIVITSLLALCSAADDNIKVKNWIACLCHVREEQVGAYCQGQSSCVIGVQFNSQRWHYRYYFTVVAVAWSVASHCCKKVVIVNFAKHNRKWWWVLVSQLKQ